MAATILQLVLGGIFKLIESFIGKGKLIQAQTEAEAKKKAIESVAPVRDLEEEIRKGADYRDPPHSPKPGQRWVTPEGKVKEFTGEEWVDATEEDDDVFGDAAFGAPL